MRKKLLLVCLLFLIGFTNSQGQSENPILNRFESKAKVGFKDENGKIVIPAIYDAASEFKNDTYTQVKLNNKIGFIDNHGNQISKMVYPDWLFKIGADMFKIKWNNREGVFSANLKKEIIPPVFFKVEYLPELHLLKIQVADFKDNEKHVYMYDYVTPDGVSINSQKNIIETYGLDNIKLAYNIVNETNFVRFQAKNGKYGYKNIKTGKVVISAKYSDADKEFYNGVAAVKIDDKEHYDKAWNSYIDNWGLIDSTGKILMPFKYQRINTKYNIDICVASFSNPVTGLSDLVYYNVKTKEEVYEENSRETSLEKIQKSNSLVLASIFDKFYIYKDGDDYQLINQKDKSKSDELRFLKLFPLAHTNFIKATDFKGNLFLLNYKGDVIKSFYQEYDDINSRIDDKYKGLLFVYQRYAPHKFYEGIIDLQGNVIVPCKFGLVFKTKSNDYYEVEDIYGKQAIYKTDGTLSKFYHKIDIECLDCERIKLIDTYKDANLLITYEIDPVSLKELSKKQEAIKTYTQNTYTKTTCSQCNGSGTDPCGEVTTCYDCRGKGYIGSTCSYCDGSGREKQKVTTDYYTNNYNNKVGTSTEYKNTGLRCSHCHGSGISGTKCTKCDGNGGFCKSAQCERCNGLGKY